ncbi:unnamed protein product [Adineta ricciae]|uniref:Uncharacterized protein n=1 Tax=Adineta ricciae TaxID=249248 RepID=A0A815IAT9_ADIRI|nr:unnamed protein product [Adineta ricciae]CAF1361281.1 unnamed protein product [Adineta ricciae]
MSRLNSQVPPIRSCPSLCATDLQQLLGNQSENPLINLATHATSTKKALNHFNMRVTQRLHRYRSMKKQWQEVATSKQSILSLLPSDDLLVIQDSMKNTNWSSKHSLVDSKVSSVSDCSQTTVVTDPLHSKIRQDLMKLRKVIKQNQIKSDDAIPFIPLNSIRLLGEPTSVPTTSDNQENQSSSHVNKEISSSLPSLNKLKPLDLVQISGCRMRSSTLPKSDSTDSGLGSTSNSSSTCSQYCKQQRSQQQNHNKTVNICNYRVNHQSSHPTPPLPSDSATLRASPLLKKNANTSNKMTHNGRSKQTLPSRLSLLIPSAMNKKQPNFTKQETRISHMRQVSTSADVTTRLYTYASSSSSNIPQSLKLKRDASLLPILLHSSSCVGLQPRISRSKKPEYTLEDDQEERYTNDDDDNYYHLLDYKQLINRLPKPIISNRPRYGKDDYGILFDQLAHIRDRMSDSNTYDEYARTT